MGENAQANFRRLVSRFLNQVEYARELSDESPFFPQHIHIEPTNSCNLRCIHCIQDSMTRKRGVMEWDVFTKVMDEIAPLGCSITLDVQGEPMLHPRCLDMVEYAKSNGCHVSLLTNATRLNEEAARRLIDLKLDRVVFSFDAIDKELYEKIRVKADFDKVFRNILRFVDLNYQAGRPTFICASIILQEATVDHLQAYKEYFNALPVNTIFVSNLLNMSGGSEVSGEIDLTGKKATPKADWPICRVPWENLTVNWDGSVCNCPLDYNLSVPVGDVKKQTLQEIWNSEPVRAFRRAHLRHDYSGVETRGKLCSECNCLWDPEYDLRRFKEFATEAIVRQARHFAASLIENQAESGDTPDEEAKYRKLQDELRRINAA